MILSAYLKRHAFREQLINSVPDADLGLVVVVPVHDEESVLKPLHSLQECNKIQVGVEVILVFNLAELDGKSKRQTNEKAKQQALNWHENLSNPSFHLHIINEPSLPQKHAGVGLARKIGMDEAIRRFEHINNNKGIIVCFDADSSCDTNYLIAIEQHFKNYPQATATSIYFEHPLEGNEFTDDVYRGITFYELHLRYYKQALAFANLPFAFHTIGSSMAVLAEPYCKEGGMNKRKAGEDFYFLQKFIKLGNFSELNKTRVVPSPRPSHRVPFGTGRAIHEMLVEKREIGKSYAWENILILKDSVRHIEDWYENEANPHPLWLSFIGKEHFLVKLNEIRSQSTSKEKFRKRFFQWFDAFQCLKFMHYLRDHHQPNQGLLDSVSQLLNTTSKQAAEPNNAKAYLEILRKRDRFEN
ncbi:MAG: hypothetical protein RIC95_06360 [Vicingaceae bacterium]